MNLERMMGSFRIDRSRNAATQVYEHLRELIVTLALKPGAPLSRTQVAEYFDVSPMPVRDALSRLDKEGLVEISPRFLTRVRGIDLDSARQAHLLRLSVELEIVHGLAQRADPAMVQTLLGSVARQRSCLEADDLDGFIRFDMEFHKSMFGAARMMDIWDLIRNVSANLDRLRRLHIPVNGKARSVLEDHAGIARAIKEGDPLGAQAWVRRHLSGTLSELGNLRDRYPDYILPADGLADDCPSPQASVAPSP
jgi:DNA-binding GntR family transcriptional regulator